MTIKNDLHSLDPDSIESLNQLPINLAAMKFLDGTERARKKYNLMILLLMFSAVENPRLELSTPSPPDYRTLDDIVAEVCFLDRLVRRGFAEETMRRVESIPIYPWDLEEAESRMDAEAYILTQLLNWDLTDKAGSGSL